MTVIENLNPRTQYTYTNEKQEYPITFPYIERQYVKCMVGSQELTYNVHYQVPPFDSESLKEDELYLTLLITPNADLDDGIKIEVGDTITIYRATPLDQQAEFPQEAKFSSQKITEALDKLTHQQQEQQDDLNTCLRLAKNIPIGFNTELPSPAANQVIQWNEDGTQLINYDLREEIKTIDTKANKAVDTAEKADTTAKQALSIANKASTTATSAMNTANDADTKSDTAISTANQAALDASKAISTATAASQTASTASQIATAASEKVDNIEEDVAVVIEAAEKINELEEAIETVTTAATNASTAATNASTAATNALTAADTATQKAQEVSQALNNMATINETSLLDGGNISLQVPLVSGTNIKTINSNSILGSGDLTLDVLPDQEGNADKFLKTDGTDASWAEIQFNGFNLFDIIQKDHILTFEESKGLERLGEYVYKEADSERYGYSDFYEKCIDEYNNKDNTKENIYVSSNITNNNLLDRNGVISAFSSSNYAALDEFSAESNTNWEITLKVKMPNNSLNSAIIGSGVEVQKYGLTLRTNTANKLLLYVSGNSTNWNIANAITSVNTFELDKEYLIKISYNCFRVNKLKGKWIHVRKSR